MEANDLIAATARISKDDGHAQRLEFERQHTVNHEQLEARQHAAQDKRQRELQQARKADDVATKLALLAKTSQNIQAIVGKAHGHAQRLEFERQYTANREQLEDRQHAAQEKRQRELQEARTVDEVATAIVSKALSHAQRLEFDRRQTAQRAQCEAKQRETKQQQQQQQQLRQAQTIKDLAVTCCMDRTSAIRLSSTADEQPPPTTTTTVDEQPPPTTATTADIKLAATFFDTWIRQFTTATTTTAARTTATATTTITPTATAATMKEHGRPHRSCGLTHQLPSLAETLAVRDIFSGGKATCVRCGQSRSFLSNGTLGRHVCLEMVETKSPGTARASVQARTDNTENTAASDTPSNPAASRKNAPDMGMVVRDTSTTASTSTNTTATATTAGSIHPTGVGSKLRLVQETKVLLDDLVFTPLRETFTVNVIVSNVAYVRVPFSVHAPWRCTL